MKTSSPERFQSAYNRANLNLQIREAGVTAVDDRRAYDFLRSGERRPFGLQQVVINRDTLPYVVGRPLIMHNAARRVFSPAVVTRPDPAFPNAVHITLFQDETFHPGRGLTTGHLVGVSAKAQSRAPGFGGHDGSIRQEPGHFGGLFVAASNHAERNALIGKGDQATDRILKDGMPESLIANVGLQQEFGNPRTEFVNFADSRVAVPAFWHPDTMQDRDGVPLRADYPGSTEVLFGAAIDKGGQPLVAAATGLAQYLVSRPRG